MLKSVLFQIGKIMPETSDPKPLSDSAPFKYVDFDIVDSTLSCNYELGDFSFTEKIVIEGDWSKPQTQEAARLVFLLAGISYYKSHAPSKIDLGQTPVRSGEIDFLIQYYKGGLGEFSYKNGLSLKNLVIDGGVAAGPAPIMDAPENEAPLIPFGGGIDSIVTVELSRRSHPSSKLFVMSPGTTKFAALEEAAKVTGLEIIRAERHLDPQILKSKENGFLNGHVPVTGILSAIAITAATINNRTAVLMSNERSASEGNLIYDGSMINHQYSKSIEFENLFREVLTSSFGAAPDWFSFLRHRNEMWIAKQFSQLKPYHPVFRSCNRAFHIKEEDRAITWCGVCDKCCFIDLILSPFVPQAELSEMFGGKEPLDNSELVDVFISLVSSDPAFNKPFECVGDIGECRQAVIAASQRHDRQGNAILGQLIKFDAVDSQEDEADVKHPHNIPEAYATPSIVD